MSARPEQIEVGYVSGLHGVTGWVKVFSYTDPPANIFDYRPWTLSYGGSSRSIGVADTRLRGRVLIARLEGIDDRDQAAPLVGAKIFVPRDRLPPAGEGEFYWADLVGLEVVTGDGRSLGTVVRLFETGANDVLVVHGERERLIPWILGDVIDEVDLDAGRIRVHWDPDF